jgi:hypothetical protein
MIQFWPNICKFLHLDSNNVNIFLKVFQIHLVLTLDITHIKTLMIGKMIMMIYQTVSLKMMDLVD